MSDEYIIGKNPLIEAIRSGRTINKIYISEQINRQTENEIRRLIKEKSIPLQKVPRKKLNDLTRGKHQGIVAIAAGYSYASLDEVLQRAEAVDEQPFLLILDELEDPHNLGAILRTADATGAHGVIIPKRRAVGLTETVAKASAGAVEHVPVVRVTNIARTIDTLKDKHIWVVGTDGDGSEDYRTLDGETAIAIVIGNEGRGMSRLVKEKCDWLVRIPMQGAIPSLNASVAASILMYEIYRKRNPLGEG
ncbi:MAG TPA: 23S rRNA (guanosine(2251)-2'-O)-methyltransferase RlmB [Pseudogracilibacillus sp.]|nr:23S rRNA (guanosine(2251)-2'-O)-methyltransferase RlmB [Pseudogracilibacillus sp.]